MAKLALILILFCLAIFGQALTPSSFLTTVDKERLKRIFESGFAQDPNDPKNAHYAVYGFSLLGIKFPKEADACSLFKKTASAKDAETLFHVTSGAVLIKCAVSVENAKGLLEGFLTNGIKVEDLYYTVVAMKNLNLKVDAQKVKTLLDGILKKDSSAPVQAYSFHIVSLLDLNKKDVKKYFDDVEDALQQADESDGQFLYYENGLFTTAFIVDGIYKIAAKYGEAPKVPEDKVVKLANFLISRRHTYQMRAATYLTAALKILSTNSYQVPACITLHSPMTIHEKQPKVAVQVSNLWGEALVAKPDDLSLVVESAKNLANEATYLNNEPFKSTATNGVYELNLMSTKASSVRGFYLLKVTAKKKSAADKRLIALTGASIEVKVTTHCKIEKVELSTRDREQGLASTSKMLQYPTKATETLHADSHQKVTLKFSLEDTNGPIQAHQTFVKLTHDKTKQEIIFVAELDKATNTYRFNLDVATSAKEFDYLSGLYAMDLIVGDALIENPTEWHFANIDLQLPASPNDEAASKSAGKRSGPPDSRATTNARPVIDHFFRPPEKRAGSTVSLVFTGLCALPIVILLALWMKLGVNISNFSFSLSALGFHGGIAAVFGLYYCYWRYLDMFTTLRYLVFIGLGTFFFGNRLLRIIAAKRQKS